MRMGKLLILHSFSWSRRQCQPRKPCKRNIVLQTISLHNFQGISLNRYNKMFYTNHVLNYYSLALTEHLLVLSENLNLLVTVMEWYRAKCLIQLRLFSDLLCCHLSSNHSEFIPQSSMLCLHQKHLVAKEEKFGEKCTWMLPLTVSLSYLKGSLILRKILRHKTDCFISPPKEIVLWIFIALKNLLFSAGFEPATLGPTGNTITPTETTNLKLQGVCL
jgi:hypothetical protein